MEAARAFEIEVGVTPDGKVSCACYGEGVLEIKCPYCHKGQSIEVSTQDTKFCVKKMLMVCLNWNAPMLTIIKYKHSYLFVMLTIVIFVYAHSPAMKSMIFIKNALLKNTEFWEHCVTKSKHFF